MGGLGCGLAGAPLGIGACYIEIAQYHRSEIMGAGNILQNPFCHQLGAGIGTDGRSSDAFAEWLRRIFRIDSGGGGKNELPHAAFDQGRDQHVGFDHVVFVIAQRIGDRFRHHDRAGEVNDGIDAMLSRRAL